MAESERLAKKSRFSGGMVTIRVGTGECSQDFQVHEDIIETKSEYFRKAFDSKWAEGQTRTIELPEDDIETDDAFCDKLIEAFTAACQPIAGSECYYSGKEAVTIIYDGTPPSSPARRFMIPHTWDMAELRGLARALRPTTQSSCGI